MPQNDYFVIAFRILNYLYACVKGEDVFDRERVSAPATGINQSYWAYIIHNMNADGYIKGVVSKESLGIRDNTPVVLRYDHITITPKGIEYLQDKLNDTPFLSGCSTNA